MPPAYDLILKRSGQLQIETVQVSDAAAAWRLGCERFPDCIRGVVCRDHSSVDAAEPDSRS